jgi:phosphohistidine swiveling domain-containing protein
MQLEELLKGCNRMATWLELAHEKRGHLYPTALYWVAAQRACKEVGVSDGVIATWYVNHEFSYLTTVGGFSRAGKVILQEFKKDKHFLEKIIEVNTKEIPIMLKATKKLSGSGLGNLSGKELHERWKDWLEKFYSMMRWSVMGTVMEMESPILTNEVEKILKKKLSKGSNKIGEYFQVLTTSIKRTVAAQEEIDLLKLRLLQFKNKLADSALNKHTKQYSWIAFGYDGPGWSKKDITHRLDELSDSESVVKKLLKEKEHTEKYIQNQQQKIVKEIKLNNEEEYLFHVLRTLGFWKFERKFQNQQAHEMMEDFIKEIAHRNQLTIAQVKMIAPDEMEEVLTKDKVNVDILNERIKESVVIFSGASYDVLSGAKVAKVSKEIRSSLTVDPNITELEGTTAYPGIAQGIARQVDEPHEMQKLNDGDILISASTSPHILPAMKRAGAIVTNSGGITCHAAIVAREIKIPTLIGTKIATKVFKDGDKIEVNATKGMIRKLS